MAPHLPPNVRFRNGGYYFKDKVTGRETYLGRKRSLCIEKAQAINLEIGAMRIRPKAETYCDDAPLSEGTIAGMSATIMRRSGVYFLLDGGSIVYVGKSIDCSRRLEEHKADPSKLFDAYYVLDTHADDLSRVESAYIAKFRPPLNGTGAARLHTKRAAQIDKPKSATPVDTQNSQDRGM